LKKTLKVETTPAGAKIFLDGSDSGKVSPCELEPSTGSHTIKAVLEGYADAEQQVDIKKGKNSVSITLAAATYTISAPAAGANVQREATCLISWNSNAMAASFASPMSKKTMGVAAVNLELYQGDTKLSDIALGVPNSGSYSWNVPATMSEASNRRILISCPSLSASRAFGPAFNVLGFKEDFSDNTANFWLPNEASTWKAAGGYYTCTKHGGWLGMSIYNFAYSATSYTVESKMRYSEWIGGKNEAPIFIMLGVTNNYSDSSGYLMGSFMNGQIAVYKLNHYNLRNPHGGPPTLLHHGTCSAIEKGVNKWNTVKIVRKGTSYKFYINNTQAYSFSDSTYNPKYIMIGFGAAKVKTVCDFDYVHMTVNQ
jgi:hypothetical protein